MGNSGCFPRGKPAGTESRYPTYGTCRMFYSFHNPPNSDMDYRIFNVRTDVNACDCTRVCTDTRKRVCTESWPWEKSPLPHRGIEAASAACRSDALATELHPHTNSRVLAINSIHSEMKTYYWKIMYIKPTKQEDDLFFQLLMKEICSIKKPVCLFLIVIKKERKASLFFYLHFFVAGRCKQHLSKDWIFKS